MSYPLHGLRVLDLTRLVPGAFATLMLAELGADVIKIEDPRGGDPMRQLPPLVDGRGVFDLLLNRGKRSMKLDLRNEEGAAVLRKLLARSDILLENYRAGVMDRAHDLDESLSASVLLENLACKATGALALEHLLGRTGFPPEDLAYAIGCGEEAVGDRYQRGGGNLGKAIAEQAGCVNASGSDVKAFCAGPIHALVVAAALVSSGVYEHVAVVAGGSLAKLGMKFAGALRNDVPVLEDVLAGLAILIGPAGNGAPTIRLDAVGRHRVGSGSAQQAVLEDLVVEPLGRLGRGILDVDRYATELHDPEITEPAGAGNVPQRNYKLIGALAVKRGELERQKLDDFERERGLPGFSPTQGHVASAVPWIPHGLEALRSGEIGSTMLVAKGSLFLGRMTELADGMSVLLEPGKE